MHAKRTIPMGNNQREHRRDQIRDAKHAFNSMPTQQLPNYDVQKCKLKLIQSTSDIIQYSTHIKTIYSRIWVKFILIYSEQMNAYRNRNQTESGIKVGNYVTYTGINKVMGPINISLICQVIEMIRGRNFRK